MSSPAPTARIRPLLLELEEKLRAIYDADAPGISFGLGARDVEVHGSPPRIVWIPTTASHGAAEKQSTNPRRLLTRNVRVVAHCWGEDFDGTEQLVHDLLRAIHKSGWGSIALLGEEWVQPTNSDRGFVALVSFAPAVPVVDVTYRKVQPTKLEKETSGAAPGDGVIEWGDS